MQTSITRFHYNICLNLGLYHDENSSKYSWDCVIDVIRFRPIKTMETSIGPNEGNSSSKDESSVPSSIPSVRKFKETPIDGLDSRFQIFGFDTIATFKFWSQFEPNMGSYLLIFEWFCSTRSMKDLSDLESSLPIGGPVTEEIISPQKSKPPPSRNPSQKSIRTLPPKPSEFLKQQSIERLKPSGIGPQTNKCRDKVIINFVVWIIPYDITDISWHWVTEAYVWFLVFFTWRKT